MGFIFGRYANRADRLERRAGERPGRAGIDAIQDADPFYGRNLDRILDEANNLILRIHFAGNLTEAIVVDPVTVQIRTAVADANLPRLLSLMFLLSPERAETHNPAAEALGSGPYKIESYDPQTGTTLVSNELYYGAAPYYERAEYKYLTSDATRVTAVQAGEVDVATLFDPQNIAVLTATATDYEISAIQSSRPISLTFSKRQYRQEFARPQGDRACPQCQVDHRQYLLRAHRASSWPGADPPYPYHNDTLSPFAYDPELSRQLLTEAGYPDGIDISFEFRNDSAFLADRSVVQAIIDQLQQVGIRVESRPVINAEYTRHVAEGIEGTLSLTGGNPPEFLYTSQMQQVQRELVESLPEYEALLASLRSLTDPAEIQEAINAATQLVYDNVSVIHLYAQPTTYALRNGVQFQIRSEDYMKAQEAGPLAAE